jgi:hypothetical protein
MLCGRICSSDYKTMLAGLEIIVLWLMIFETYIQFAKNKIAGYLFYSVFGVGEFCCGVEWKYLVVE